MEDKPVITDIIENNLRYSYYVKSIEQLFKIENQNERINHEPFYQRRYVWDLEKASFFIESLLLNVDIPPLIFFRTKDIIEIIDGRQRYETILRFLNNEFKLFGKGLTKLKHLSGDNIETLEAEYVKTLLKIQLRVYEYELINRSNIVENDEDIIKREIFKRYNTGITSLTSLEIFKAKYINNQLNSFFKNALKQEPDISNLIVNIFQIKKPEPETILKKIRMLLTLHHLPINYYAGKSGEIHRFFEYFSESINKNSVEKIIYSHFKVKLNFLQEVKQSLNNSGTIVNGLVFECLFWALTICEKENIKFEKINNLEFKKKLIQHVRKNIAKYQIDYSLYYHGIKERYNITAKFFESHFRLSFISYLRSTNEFRNLNKSLSKSAVKKENSLISNHSSFLKKDIGSISLYSLLQNIEDRSINIRPPYQREDVISKVKASSIIESVLLGIELLPIFLYLKKDGSSEVIDGQQRLLTFLSYLGKTYWNGSKMIKSDENNFSLDIKDGILKALHGNRFNQLSKEMQDKIMYSNIRVVEIKEENNPNFDPVDLFMRLNFKPYPIKDNSFEAWNSFIDKKTIDEIKLVCENNKDWFYLDKTNERMYNEELLTCLIYFTDQLNKKGKSFDEIKKILAIYPMGGGLTIRISNKKEITTFLTEYQSSSNFQSSLIEFDISFTRKVKSILNFSLKGLDMGSELDNILCFKNKNNARTNFRFYILWMILSGISLKSFRIHSNDIRQEIINTFSRIRKVKKKEQLETMILHIWSKYELN